MIVKTHVPLQTGMMTQLVETRLTPPHAPGVIDIFYLAALSTNICPFYVWVLFFLFKIFICSHPC